MADVVHMTLVKLGPDYDDALAVDHVVEHAFRTLKLVPGVEHFEVLRALPDVIPMHAQVLHHHGPPPERKWDLLFTFRLSGQAAHERFKSDPDRLAFFDQFLAPKAASIKAWSFNVIDDPTG